MFLHSFYTWLVANVLHTVFYFYVATFLYGHAAGAGDVFFLFNTLIYSITYSFPCLLAGWACLYIISQATCSMVVRFFIWLLCAPLLILLECFLEKGVDVYINSQSVLYVFSAMSAVFLSILFRFCQFRQLIYPTQNDYHEPTMV